MGAPWKMNNITSIPDFQQLTYEQWENEYVMINFTSDGSYSQRGFRIEYYTGTFLSHAFKTLFNIAELALCILQLSF